MAILDFFLKIGLNFSNLCYPVFHALVEPSARTDSATYTHLFKIPLFFMIPFRFMITLYFMIPFSFLICFPFVIPSKRRPFVYEYPRSWTCMYYTELSCTFIC